MDSGGKKSKNKTFFYFFDNTLQNYSIIASLGGGVLHNHNDYMLGLFYLRHDERDNFRQDENQQPDSPKMF